MAKPSTRTTVVDGEMGRACTIASGEYVMLSVNGEAWVGTVEQATDLVMALSADINKAARQCRILADQGDAESNAGGHGGGGWAWVGHATGSPAGSCGTGSPGSPSSW